MEAKIVKLNEAGYRRRRKKGDFRKFLKKIEAELATLDDDVLSLKLAAIDKPAFDRHKNAIRMLFYRKKIADQYIMQTEFSDKSGKIEIIKRLDRPPVPE